MSGDWSDERMGRAFAGIQKALEGKMVVDLPEPNDEEGLRWASPEGEVRIMPVGAMSDVVIVVEHGKLDWADAREYALALLAASVKAEQMEEN
jgi:hypothetical protein